MEVISKQAKSKSHEEFEKLLSQDLGNRKFKEGGIATGIIEEIGNKFVFIDLGLKSSGAVPIEEFKLTKELDKIKVGSKIEVLLEKIENRDGEIVISREKARKVNSWNRMQKAFEDKKEVKGVILSKCKGGFIVDVDSCLCFLPGSQIDIRPLKSYDHLMNSPQTFEVCKIDKKRTKLSKIAFSSQSFTGYQPIDKTTYNYCRELLGRLSKNYDISIIGHYVDDVYAWKDLGLPIIYSYDSNDYFTLLIFIGF